MTEHCELCGSTRYEDLDGDEGYTACCNEPTCTCPSPERHADPTYDHRAAEATANLDRMLRWSR
jgi:hypothetical protein